MKGLCLVLVLVFLFAYLAFGEAGKQEEVDFLLFLPNSGNQFVNEEQAMIQLDNAADYLTAGDISPGKITVYGYAAAAANGIEPVNLSRDRALYVINELQKRGVAEDLFAEPIACGSVDLWGGNTGEKDRSLNRRVRILLDDTVLTPAARETSLQEARETSLQKAREASLQKARTVCTWEEKQPETASQKTGSRFPWWIIPLALLGLAVLAAIVFFAYERRKSSTVIPAANSAAPSNQKIYVLTEDELRRHAYKLYQQRNSRSEDATQDWYRSVHELTAYYEAQGYWVILYWEIQALSA